MLQTSRCRRLAGKIGVSSRAPKKWVDPKAQGPLPSEFFVSAQHQAVCVSMATRYSRSNKIDKAFRIATPMRKASWTKRFAEGWGGAAGCEWRWWQRWGGLEGMGRRCEREIAPKARSVREAAPSLAGRRGARVSESAFQVTCPSGSRHAETRILAKEPRPATTAVGTSRQGRVAIRRLVDSSIGRFRQLAQRLREA